MDIAAPGSSISRIVSVDQPGHSLCQAAHKAYKSSSQNTSRLQAYPYAADHFSRERRDHVLRPRAIIASRSYAKV